MPWIAINDSHLLTILAGPKLAGIREAALADGQADPVQPVVDQVTAEVRAAVAASGKYLLGDGNTVPDELLSAALDIFVVRFGMRVEEDPSEGRIRLMDQALKRLEAVANGKLALSIPTIPEDMPLSGGSGLPSIRAKCRKFTNRDQDGI